MSKGTEVTVNGVVSATCPCGGSITFGNDTKNGTPMGFHSIPPCLDFFDRDLLSYIQWLNEAALHEKPEAQA